MSTLMFRSFVALGAGAALVYLGAAQAGWAPDLGVGDWNSPGTDESTARAMERHDELLESRRVAVLSRLEAKRHIIGDLLANRKSLLQAAGEFRAWNETSEQATRNCLRLNPGKSEGEHVCRQVIEWAYREAADVSPSHADAVKVGLEAQLEALLAKNGKIVLPD
jgi:hypothetical protein